MCRSIETAPITLLNREITITMKLMNVLTLIFSGFHYDDNVIVTVG